MHVGEWMIVIATILGPVLAVQAQKMIERWRSKQDRRFDVFSKLMTTRATLLSPQHVEALNRIDLEFYGDKKYKKVIDAWKAYHDHLNQNTTGEANNAIWENTRNELLVDLLYEMGESLGYEFNKVHIKRAAYFPKGHGDIEQDQTLIRKYMVALLKGDQALKMNVVGFPEMEETDGQKAVQRAVLDVVNLQARALMGATPESLPKEDGLVPVRVEPARSDQQQGR
jgi:hypothetical protein